MVRRGDASVNRLYIARWHGLPVALLDEREATLAKIRCRDPRVLGWSDEEIDEALSVVFRNAPEFDDIPDRWDSEVIRRLDTQTQETRT